MEAGADSLDELVRRNLVARNKQTLVVTNDDGTTTFCCVVCPMKYEDKESMELHLCMHNKEYRFICSICGTGLKRKEHLERHTQGHYEVRPHVCPDCGKAFKRKEHLTIHSAIHSGHKDLACQLCARTFHRKDHLQKHMQSHSKKFLRQGVPQDGELMQIKTEYQEMSPVIFDVRKHAAEYDDNQAGDDPRPAPVDPLRPFQCSLCPKTYKRRDHLKLHTQTHLRNNFKCAECGLGFSTEAQLFVHMNTHLKSESPLECESLQPELQIVVGSTPWQSLTSNDALMPRIAKEEQRPHECPVCHKRFKRRQHLVTHANVHRRADRAVWCSACNEGFATNDEFEQHDCKMETEDGGDSENINGVQMQSNVMVVIGDEYLGKEQEESPPTPEPAPPVPQRVFVCKYCGKPFRRRDHYKIHLNIHTGEKSFFCSHCGKGFYRKDHLQKHEPIHTRQKRKKAMPELFPISHLQQKRPSLPLLPNLPEITIHAPSNAKLRIPLQMKVPYEVVTSTEYGEERSVIHPQEQCVR